jgi:membrane fusion protein, multidrug efflux system
VKTPISGIVTRKNAEQGEFVNIGSAIADIADISKLKANLNVSESNAYRLKIGDSASVSTDVYPGISFHGLVTYIGSQGDDAHNYPVEIVIDNTREHPLRAGTFVAIHIDLRDTHERLYIPRLSLQGSSDGAAAYVVEHGHAALKRLSLGAQTGEYIEVIMGIAEGDTVVTAGQINLADGATVSIVKN